MTRSEREEMKRLWKEGTIGVMNGKGGNVGKVAHFLAKVYDEPSEYGINEGRISKLTIKIDGQTTLCYDRGWDIEPDENDELTQIALAIILNDYN